MTVTVEPLAIGSLDGPRVFIVVRQVGTHKDIEECPDRVKTLIDAILWAAHKWSVPIASVLTAETQVVEI